MRKLHTGLGYEEFADKLQEMHYVSQLLVTINFSFILYCAHIND